MAASCASVGLGRCSGIDKWPGKQIHSHNYRVPDPFCDQVVLFPQFELQSKWIAGVLSGRITVESTEEMTADIEAFYSSLEASGIPKRYAHEMGESQFEYDDWLAAKSGSPPIQEWRKQIIYSGDSICS